METQNLYWLSQRSWHTVQFIAQYSNDHDTTVNVLKQAITIQLKRIRLYEQLKMINTLIREKICTKRIFNSIRNLNLALNQRNKLMQLIRINKPELNRKVDFGDSNRARRRLATLTSVPLIDVDEPGSSGSLKHSIIIILYTFFYRHTIIYSSYRTSDSMCLSHYCILPNIFEELGQMIQLAQARTN